MDLQKIADELKVPVESLTKYNNGLMDKYLVEGATAAPKSKKATK